MVVNNPNNWHWVDKNCMDWARAYFNEHLVGTAATQHNVKVTAVLSLEGDVEVCQRKGKVILIFDLRIVLSFEGTGADDSPVKGSVTVPELAYDTEADEIQFDVSIYNENKESEPVRAALKKEVVPQLRALLAQFGTDLIQTHGLDIQLESDKVSSKFTKENQAQKDKAAAAAAAPKATAPKAAQSKEQKTASGTLAKTVSGNVPKYNTSTLHLEPTFNTTAEQLYITLLDQDRVSAWTRSSARISAAEGSEFQLFGGSISGRNTKLVANERICQQWRLDSWKEGHFAELDIQLKQGAGETTMVVKWLGIPIGEEDRVRGNFEDYYVRAIKLTFGFGAVL